MAQRVMPVRDERLELTLAMRIPARATWSVAAFDFMGGMSSKYYGDLHSELKPMIISLADMPQILAEGCQHPDCTHTKEEHNELAMHQQCHPGAGSIAWLKYQDGAAIIELKCRTCNKHIAAFWIGHKPRPVEP